MHKILLMPVAVILLVVASCGSTANARAEWYIKDVSAERRLWRYCSEDKDGPGKAGKGICYISQKCIKKVLRREKCENVYMFCSFGDIHCFIKNKWPAVAKGN